MTSKAKKANTTGGGGGSKGKKALGKAERAPTGGGATVPLATFEDEDMYQEPIKKVKSRELKCIAHPSSLKHRDESVFQTWSYHTTSAGLNKKTYSYPREFSKSTPCVVFSSTVVQYCDCGDNNHVWKASAFLLFSGYHEHDVSLSGPKVWDPLVGAVQIPLTFADMADILCGGCS